VLLLLLLGLVLLLAIAGGYAWWLSQQRPEWWHEVPLDEPTQVQAEQVENTVVSELSRARPAEAPGPYRSREWQLEVSEEEANAWLATRLKGWVANRDGHWPQAIDGVQVALEPGQVRVGIHLVQGGFDRVVTVTGLPEIRDGGVWLNISGMALGGLPLPREFLLDQFGSMVRGDSTDDILAALEGQRPALDRPVIELDNGRLVRITGVRVDAGRLVLTCRTEKD